MDTSVIFSILGLDTSVFFFIVSLILFTAGSLSLIFFKKSNSKPFRAPVTGDNLTATHQLQLQAYERLILLTNRIALPGLIARMNQPDLSATDMQLLLTQTIKQEFDHNITQQIYVSADAWNAVKNLKEQNMLIINQCAQTLSVPATGLDLNKRLLEFLMQDKKGNLHEVVSEVLSYEAKKLL
jgi:hypothetical protein